VYHRLIVVLVERRHHRLLFAFSFFLLYSFLLLFLLVHSSIDSFGKLHGEFAFLNAPVGTHAALTWVAFTITKLEYVKNSRARADGLASFSLQSAEC